MSNKISIRPTIQGLNNDSSSFEEQLQNDVLRPIIKMQHDLLVAYFKVYLLNKKCKFKALSELKRIEFIKSAFQKDIAFKTELKGIIIGHFTPEEFESYCLNKRDFNKRILTMIEQRLTSVQDLFIN